MVCSKIDIFVLEIMMRSGQSVVEEMLSGLHRVVDWIPTSW